MSDLTERLRREAFGWWMEAGDNVGGWADNMRDRAQLLDDAADAMDAAEAEVALLREWKETQLLLNKAFGEQYEAAEAKLTAIDALHQRSDERRRWDLSLEPIPHCSFDGEPWPCDTYRILHPEETE